MCNIATLKSTDDYACSAVYIVPFYPREKEVAFTKVTASLDEFLRSGYIVHTGWYLWDGRTVKLGFKELLNKEQIGNSEPFPVTNLLVYLINSEQIGINEQFCVPKSSLMPSLALIS